MKSTTTMKMWSTYDDDEDIYEDGKEHDDDEDAYEDDIARVKDELRTRSSSRGQRGDDQEEHDDDEDVYEEDNDGMYVIVYVGHSKHPIFIVFFFELYFYT